MRAGTWSRRWCSVALGHEPRRDIEAKGAAMSAGSIPVAVCGARLERVARVVVAAGPDGYRTGRPVSWMCCARSGWGGDRNYDGWPAGVRALAPRSLSGRWAFRGRERERDISFSGRKTGESCRDLDCKISYADPGAGRGRDSVPPHYRLALSARIMAKRPRDRAIHVSRDGVPVLCLERSYAACFSIGQ